jgi:hypothetical protein
VILGKARSGANIDDNIGLPDSPSRDRVPSNPNDPAVRLARQAEGGGCVGDGFGYPRSLLKLFGLYIDSQKRQVFNLRKLSLQAALHEIRFGHVQWGEVFELTQSRSQTQGLEKADKPESVRRDAGSAWDSGEVRSCGRRQYARFLPNLDDTKRDQRWGRSRRSA